jgi:signal transduction histidine kinase
MKNFSLFFFLLLYNAYSFSQSQIYFRKTQEFSTGLNQYVDAFQDHAGVFWISENYKLLACDGERTKTFFDKSNVIYTQINKIAPINDDSIMVGTDHGLGILTKGILKPIGLNKAIWGMSRVKQNYLYIGTTSGMYKWEKGKLELIESTKKLDVGEISTDAKGDAYFSTLGSLYKLERGDIKRICKTASLFSIPLVTSKNEVYFGDTILYKIVNGKPVELFHSSVPITNISEGPDGRLVFCANNLFEVKNDTVEEIYQHKVNNPILKSFFGNDGKLYIIDYNYMYVETTKLFNQVGIPIGNTLYYSKTSDSTYRKIYEKKGEIFLDISGKSIKLYEKYKPQNFHPKDIAGNIMDAIFLSDTEFYISFLQNCVYFHAGKAESFIMPRFAYCSYLYFGHEQNEIWVMTSNGPVSIKGNKLTHYSKSNVPGFPGHTSISSILPDPIQKILWIGSFDGDFGYLDLVNKNFVRLDSSLGLRKGNEKFKITTIISDRENNIWVSGLNKGLYKIIRKVNSNKNFELRLWDTNAADANYKFDGKGNLWGNLGGELRVYKANSQGILENPLLFRTINLVTDFNEISELKEHTSSDFDRHYTSDKIFTYSIYLHSYYTLDILLDKLFDEKRSHPVVFTNLILKRSSINWDSAGYKTNTLGVPIQPKFKYDLKDLGFQFGSYSSATGNGLYRFKLNGYDSAWTVSKTTEIYYGNLSDAKYSFEVQFSYDGIHWGSSSYYSFEILPPWWTTWWFRSLCFIALVGLILLYIHYRTKSLYKKTKLLEDEVNKRTNDLLKSNMELGRINEELNANNKKNEILISVLAHDVKSPMRFLSDVSTNLYNSWDDIEDERKRSLALEIKKSTKSIYIFLSEFLTWIKLNIEKGVSRHIETVNVLSLLQRVKKYHEETGNVAGNVIEIDLANDLVLKTNKNYLEIIIRNLVDNACKYTANGKIYLSAYPLDSGIVISCRDTGKGMSSDLVNILMFEDSYEENKAQDELDSYKLGYRFIKDMMKEMDAQIEIISELNKGTEVKIILK